MNFLAHTYLSGNSDEILVGNFIGDFVKGRYFTEYADNIQKGIVLHRNIDRYTDIHPVVKLTKSLFTGAYGKYSGIVVDVIYDHFLAYFWEDYALISLEEYIEKLHSKLSNYYTVFPAKVKSFFPTFVKNNWIKSYASLTGIERVLYGMSRNTSLPQKTNIALKIIDEHYEDIGEDFNLFFPQIISYVIARHNILFDDPFRRIPATSYTILA